MEALLKLVEGVRVVGVRVPGHRCIISHEEFLQVLDLLLEELDGGGLLLYHMHYLRLTRVSRVLAVVRRGIAVHDRAGG